VTLPDAVQGKWVTLEGDRGALAELAAMLDTFGFWFNLIEP
jgi:alkyl sulfatase BDS1-like metallo-beta-lactamase superfamily hydrolase